MLQVRQDLSVRPTHNTVGLEHKSLAVQVLAVRKVNKAAVWASNKNRIDFNTVGLEHKPLAVQVLAVHTEMVEVARDVEKKVGKHVRRETHFHFEPKMVASTGIVRLA
jgi:hypothetical protein